MILYSLHVLSDSPIVIKYIELIYFKEMQMQSDDTLMLIRVY